MSFEYWLLSRAHVTNDPVGDFIDDARDHTNFCRRNKERPPFAKVTSLAALRKALPVTACVECVSTLPKVWRRYRSWERAHE